MQSGVYLPIVVGKNLYVLILLMFLFWYAAFVVEGMINLSIELY
jgi:hypothetical protein